MKKNLSVIMLAILCIILGYSISLDTSIADISLEEQLKLKENYDLECVVRANVNTGIYHNIDSPWFNMVKEDNVECFEYEKQAIRQGYRKFHK